MVMGIGMGNGNGNGTRNGNGNENKLSTNFVLFMSQILHIPCRRHGDVYIAKKMYLSDVK